MTLAKYEHDMQRCTRCSYCKWVAWKNQRHPDFTQGCPSVTQYNWHAYSAGGRFNMAYAFLNERIDYSDALLEAIYKCQMDGNCDVSCKAVQDIEPLQCMQELRIRCVEDGQFIPEHKKTVDHLRKQDNMMLAPKADRGKWAEGLDIKDLTKEKAKVAYYAGCRYSYDEELWPYLRSGLTLLSEAGVDIGIMGSGEVCCGGRAYQMGFADELPRYAERNMKALKKAGVDTLVTPCADGYQTFKVLYDKIGQKLDIKIYHITEYLHLLIKEEKIKMIKKFPAKVTYHDPCHLGRLSEPWIHWEGKEVKALGQMIVHDPPKKFRRGASGVYDVPREILKSIPGLELIEMYRTRESAWCCGAGGGVKEAYPDFALSTAVERIEEAKAVGAEAIVSACPWCTRNFMDSVKETGIDIKIYDIMQLIRNAN